VSAFIPGRRVPWLALLVALLVGLPNFWTLPQPPAPMALPLLAEAGPPPTDKARFRYSLSLPFAAGAQELYFISLSPGAQLSLNGHVLFTRKAPDGIFAKARAIPVLLQLPATLLLPGDNEVMLETSGVIRPQRVAPAMFAGPAGGLARWFTLAWLSLEVYPLVVLSAALIFGVVLLALWNVRRNEVAYLAMAGLMLLFASNLLQFLSPTLDLPAWVLVFCNSNILIKIALVPFFLATWFRQPVTRWIWVNIPLSVLLVLVILALPEDFRVRNTELLFLPFLAYSIFCSLAVMLPLAWRRREPDAQALLSILVLTVIISVVDRASHGQEVGAAINFGNGIRGMTPVFVVFGLMMINQCLHGMKALDDATAHLRRELEAAEMLLTESLERRHAEQTQALLLVERERLMRDLHDGLGNRLTAALAQACDAATPPAALEGNLREALSELRLVLTSMDDVGEDLAQGIAGFLPQLQRQLGTQGVTLECDVADLLPVPGLRTGHVQHVLRILQEAAMNAARHSGAKLVRIEAPPDTRRIVVRDRGRGGAVEKPGSLGLRTMQARALAMGATLAIATGAEGTEVTLALPDWLD
jgi:signal transduction histidine kinase